MVTVLPVDGTRNRFEMPENKPILAAPFQPGKLICPDKLICKDSASPNFNRRRDGLLADMVVLHYTAMQTAAAALERLCNPEFQVSAHYLISENGMIFQLVSEEMRAWHAGAGRWGASADVNSRSIGVELANCGSSPFPEPQMAALEGLLSGIMQRWNIAPERVIGHSDMAPARKADPGARFDWFRLANAGLSVWPAPDLKPCDETGFGDALKLFGMTTQTDRKTMLTAFRLRFRPWATGPLDKTDLAMAQDLARRFPVDRGRANT